MPSTVNPQIVDSVQTTQKLVLSPAETVALDVVHAQVTQALGLAVSDATDYMRNMSAISSAVAGVAFRQMLEDPSNAANASKTLQEANKAVESATTNLSSVGEAVSKVLASWPNGK